MAIAFTKLHLRLISALILIPVVALIIWSGHYWFGAFLGVVAGLALYEFWVMVRSGKYAFVGLLLAVIYIFVSFMLCYQLREVYGAYSTFLFFFIMWGSDTGAYFFGKLIGGPKMAGDISPNKTWAGYAGALCGAAFVLCLGTMDLSAVHVLAAIALGATGQAGDLLVSWLKRSVAVKDSGDLIPGHGGVLDRVDSLMLVVPVYIALLKSGLIL